MLLLVLVLESYTNLDLTAKLTLIPSLSATSNLRSNCCAGLYSHDISITVNVL
jgi:hypothetical protein